ncbi:MAG: NYN domain-containing protein [Candidatus Pacebacteria bacterium]|nr:NYN domain-containing protein [Candidatus Paceibacterota bacterium]MBP9818387.1 NYN domain-containing protein [Candidatus Paceibacterota bacterium]
MTVIKHSEQRVGVFIDTQNLYHSAKNLYNGARVNFGAIMKEAIGNRALIRAIAYVISTESGEEKNFFDALEKLGIEAKTKNIQIFSSGAKKADWDVGLAVDAIKMAPKLDTIIIVSGDGDFAPLVEYLQVNEGCQVEVIAFGKSSSSMLREMADDFIDMCLNPKKYVIQGNAPMNFGSRQIGNRIPQGRIARKRGPLHKELPPLNSDHTHAFDDVAPEDLE